MGQTMVIAARLMCSAVNCGVLTDAVTFEEAKAEIEFEHLLPTVIKGFQKPVVTFRPIRDRTAPAFARLHGPLVGRQQERARLLESLNALWRGKRGLFHRMPCIE